MAPAPSSTNGWSATAIEDDVVDSLERQVESRIPSDIDIVIYRDVSCLGTSRRSLDDQGSSSKKGGNICIIKGGGTGSASDSLATKRTVLKLQCRLDRLERYQAYPGERKYRTDWNQIGKYPGFLSRNLNKSAVATLFTAFR